MKKIFAIALALVMVLSMASAFASSWCRTDFDWNCATAVCDNGTGSVELIPYVKGNDYGTGNLFTVSKCAGAVNGDTIYFAIKLTVDANPNAEWWNLAKLEFSSLKGLRANSVKAGNRNFSFLPQTANEISGLIKAAAGSTDIKAGEYYLTLVPVTGGVDWKLVKAADFEADATTLFSATVENASKAKVCVKLSSENKLATGSAIIGDWTVSFAEDSTNGNLLTFTKKGGAKVGVRLDKDTDKVVRVSGSKDNGTTLITFVSMDNGMLVDNNGVRYGTACNEAALVMEVMNLFKFNFGTCMTKKAIQTNFGWSAESVSCFQWNKDALAVVNAECQVAIPKTGDVSVVAYAVMALVAAAGAMGLKK